MRTNRWNKQRRILRTELARVLSPAGEREEIRIEPEVELVDEIRAEADRELVGQQLDRKAHLAAEIRWALERIETGEYGKCGECGQPISDWRLEALPWARLCVSCQARVELLEEHPELAGAAA